MTQGTSTNGTVTTTTRSRFASGAAVKLPLSEGDWVLVRQELSYGQQRHLAHAGLTGIDASATAGDRLKVDLAAYDIERLVLWVMDWSFRDDDGDHVTVSREAIEALHPETAAEINAALDAHIEALEGKASPAPGGTTRPAPTSSSARRSAGAGTS